MQEYNYRMENHLRSKLIPIYTSRGDLGAFLLYPFIYNIQGEWIGWITAKREVYSVHGHYVGILDKDSRILRKREWSYNHKRISPPFQPPRIRPPAHAPLAPLSPEIPLNMIDVLLDDPDLLPSIDYGDLREDMD